MCTLCSPYVPMTTFPYAHRRVCSLPWTCPCLPPIYVHWQTALHRNSCTLRSHWWPVSHRVGFKWIIFLHGPKLTLNSYLQHSFPHFCSSAHLFFTPPLSQPFIPKAVCLNKMKIKSLFKPPQAINQQRKRRRGWLWTPFIPESLGLLQWITFIYFH